MVLWSLNGGGGLHGSHTTERATIPFCHEDERSSTRWRSYLKHCATSRKVAGSIPCGVINPDLILRPWSRLSV
jgi:hypothetical protein